MNLDLTTHEYSILHTELNKQQKNPVVAWLLWLFLCTLGGHRFYLGNTAMGVCMILFGWLTLFIWPLVDGFFINNRIRVVNSEIEKQIVNEIKANRY